MEKGYFTRKKSISFFLILLLFGVFGGGCASVPEKKGEVDFQTQYVHYQGYVRAGKTAINKKEYIEAIEQYSRAIDLSPFEANHYYYRGLAWYKKGNREKALEDFNRSIF